MDSFSGSGRTGSFSWPSFAPFKVSVYPRDYAASLDAQPFQAMPVYEDSCNVCDARYGFNYNWQVVC